MNPWGPIIAAMIAGFIAFIGMIITKENKVSEFRQAWIDEFREEISYLIEAYKRWVDNENFYTTHTAMKPNIGKEDIYIKAYHARSELLAEVARESKGEIERFKSRIKLRLNSDPLRRKPPEDNLDKLLDKLLNTKDLKDAEGLSKDIYHNASLILTTEWKVVKKGEESYVNSKKFLLNLAVAIGVIATISLCFHLEDALKWLMNHPSGLIKK
ncbi:hypothetical protein M1E08_09490 [Erwinia sp. PK3-005]